MSRIKRSDLSKKFLGNQLKSHTEINLPLDLVNYGIPAPTYQGPNIEIFYEDEIFLGLNKPADVPGHPLLYSDQKNCLSFLRSRGYGKWLNLYHDHEKGLLYRLDTVTSGVLLYVKDPQVHANLRLNFSDAVKTKSYWAIVSGHFSSSGRFTHWLLPTGKKGEKMQCLEQNTEGAQLAISSFKVKQYFEQQNLTWLEVSIETGARHQIRAQLAQLGSPILGDKLYSGRAADRVYLHAYSYQLNWNGKAYRFEVGNPDQFFKLASLTGAGPV